jgi:hypothetical protein
MMREEKQEVTCSSSSVIAGRDRAIKRGAARGEVKAAMLIYLIISLLFRYREQEISDY